jgi:hypothetical protein
MKTINTDGSALAGSSAAQLIIVPLKIDSTPTNPLFVGDLIKVELIDSSISKLRISSNNWLTYVKVSERLRNESRLLTILKEEGTIGRVYAIFQRHILVEIPFQSSQFHFCN